MHPSCPIKQNTWESPKYKHCLLLEQFIVSDLENVTWINQTPVFLPGRRAALVPPAMPGCCHGRARSRIRGCILRAQLRAPEPGHTPPGRQILREQALRGQSIFKQNAAPGRAALALREGDPALPAFCSKGGPENPLWRVFRHAHGWSSITFLNRFWHKLSRVSCVTLGQRGDKCSWRVWDAQP